MKSIAGVFMSHAIKKGLSKDDNRLHNLYNEISYSCSAIITDNVIHR